MQFSLADIWSHMGLAARLIVATMLVMSLMSLVVVFERLAALASSRRASVAYARTMADLLRDGDLDRAATAPEVADGGHLGRVIQAAFRAYRTAGKGDDDLVFESVARALERQAQREVHGMKRGVGILASVGSTAPFVGLLGTVLGIVNSFEMMAATGSGGLATVSSGIAEALATTALGLVVAIPAVTAYNALQGWIDGRAVDISEASNELLDLLARFQRNGRTGARPAADPRRAAGADEATSGGTPAGAIEKMTLGLVFFESGSGIAAVQAEIAAAGGLVVQASGPQYIAAFGHDGSANPCQSALAAARRLSAGAISARVLVDLAPVSVQSRPDGTPRIFSPLFAKKDRFPPATDPPGIVLTAVASRAIPDVKVLPTKDTTERFALDLTSTSTTTTTATTGVTETAASNTWRPRRDKPVPAGQ
jgi:biopolymer transport protein TolQ